MPELRPRVAAQAEDLDRVDTDFLLGHERLAQGGVHGAPPRRPRAAPSCEPREGRLLFGCSFTPNENSLTEPRVASTGLVLLLTAPPLLAAALVSEWPPRVVSSCAAQIGLCWVMSEIRFCGRKAIVVPLGKLRH